MISTTRFLFVGTVRAALGIAWFLLRASWKLGLFVGRHPWVHPHVKRVRGHAKRHHAATVGRAHTHLKQRWVWYDRWHNFRHHHKAHFGVLGIYLLGVAFSLGMFRIALASDLTQVWNFGAPGDYSTSSLAEVSSGTGRLKTNNYVSDANTMALFHLDELSGTSVDDDSSNNNDGTATSPTWASGNLNNALSLNGSSSFVSTPDSASLSLTGDNTLEAWTKFNTPFGANTHQTRQPVIDKGAYQLYYDHETGKITYELERNGSNTWVQQGGGKVNGGQVNGSWDLDGKNQVEAFAVIGTSVFAGIGSYGGGNANGDAEVWKCANCATAPVWSQVGGDGVNGSWPDDIYNVVWSMASSGDYLYAGLGDGSGTGSQEGEVWRYHNTSGTWTKVGGDGVNSSWATNYERVFALAASGSTVFAGLGANAGDGEIWSCSSCDSSPTWTKVGGDGTGTGGQSWDSTYEGVQSLHIVGTTLLAGLRENQGDAEVWSCDFSTTCTVSAGWTKRGGDGSGTSGQSWDNTYEMVFDIDGNGNTIYIALGNSLGDSEVWSCDISATCSSTAGWTKVGGDGTGTGGQSWVSTETEAARELDVDGSGNVYVGLGISFGDNEVWKCAPGCTPTSGWTKIGGDGVNSSWGLNAQVDSLLIVGNDLYVGNGQQSAITNADVWKTDLTTVSWSRIGGLYVNKSWGYTGFEYPNTMTTVNGKLYAGMGWTTGGDGTVWEFDGTIWTMIGGQGINGSWGIDLYELVYSMAGYNGNLYVGTGSTAGDGEVWKWNGSTWTKIGDDTDNSSYGVSINDNTVEGVRSMAVYNGQLCIGLGNGVAEAEVWCWNDTAWTKIGGDGVNGGTFTGTDIINSLTVFDGKLIAGMGLNVDDDDVYAFNGSTWTKIGGDGSGGGGQSWVGDSEYVTSMAVFRNKLYVGFYDAEAGTEVWECAPGCTTTSGWTKVGGDGVGGSWEDSTIEAVWSLAVYNGKLYAGTGENSNDAQVWEYNGSSWGLVGGVSAGNGFKTNLESVRSMTTYRGKLYAGTGDSADFDPFVYSYGDNLYLQSSTTSQDTNWHHVAATYDGTTAKIYIDGSQSASATSGLSMSDNTAPLYVGASQGSTGDSRPQAFFSGSLDEVRLSNVARSSFTTKPYSNGDETVRPASAVYGTGAASWDSFAESATANGGTITYRLSADGGTTWKYWDGSQWATSSSTSQANSASVINSHVSSFPIGSGGFLWQAVLRGNGDQRVILNSVTLTATSDTTAPNNPTSVTAKDSPGGSVTLTSGNWYNYAGPNFTWSTPTDPAGGSGGVSGVAGYYVYFGTDQNADPLTAGTFQTAASYTASSLTSGQSYYLRIKTKDVAGNVSATAAGLFTYKFDSTTPAAVDYVNVNPAGCSTAPLFAFSWPAASDGSSGVAGYEYRLGSSGVIQFTTELTVSAPPYQVGDNVFYVRSKDTAGNVSAWQTGIFCSTETAGVVDGPTVTSGPSSLTVVWRSSKATTSFVRVLSSTGAYISEQGQSSPTLDHTVKVVGLEPEQAYQYKLVWTDASGNPGESPLFTTTTGAAPAIRNLQAQVLGTSSALISWETTELSSATLKYGIGGLTNEQSLSGVATRFSQQLTGLQAGSSYQARVEARTQDGYPYYSVITFQTPPLPKISNLRFDYLPSAQATVRASWTTNVASTSLVRYRTGDGAFKTVSSAELVTDHTLVISDLLDNAVYELVAQSTDQFGNSGVSDTQRYETPFDTRAPKISNLTVEVRSSGIGSSQKAQIVVSWETDEPATSQIEFGPGIASDFYPSKSQEERGLTTNHVIIVSELDPAKLYHLRAVSRDRAGNQGVSVDTTAITGKVQRSVIDLIVNSLERSLGFLTKLPFLGR